ncbi:MAG TPA: GAF domain-containing protein [Anaerolineales bacterium]|nr:GAF domain-containing protein [Anaerolineales bacterium]
MTAKRRNGPRKGSKETDVSLRQRAEAALQIQSKDQDNLSSPPEDWQSVLHELHVHQFELQRQNEELRRAQAELESARDRYVDLYDFAPVGYLSLRQHGIIVAANLTATTMLGVPRNQLIGSALGRFVAETDHDTFYHHLKNFFRPQAREILKVRLVRSDGTQFDARLEGSAREGENVVQVVISDISDLKRADQALKEMNATLEQRVVERTAALRESEQRYFTIFDKSPMGFALTSMPEGVMVSVNDACLKLFEYMREEVIGQTSRELGIPDPGSRAQIVAGLQADGSVRNFEYTYTTRSGAELILSLNLDWVSIGGEEHILTTVRDITQRRKAEEALHKAYNELELRVQERTQELRLASEAERRHRELAEGLAQSVMALASSLQLEDVLNILLDQIRRAIPFRGADIMLIEGRTFRVAGYRGFEDLPGSVAALHKRYPIDEFPLFQQLCATLQPVLVPDTLQNPGWHATPGMEWVRSYLAAPLVIDGQVTGVINLTSEQPGYFTDETRERLISFAAPAALALHNAELFKAELSARQVAETLKATAQALTQTLELEQVLNTLLENINAITHADVAGVAMFEGETRLAARAAQGYERWTDLDQILSIKIDVSSNLTLQRLISTRKSLLIPDTAAFSDWQVLPELDPIHSWLLVPLVAGDKVIGLVALGKAETGYFTQEHIRWAEALVGQGVMAIQNAWLFEQVRAGQERFQSLSRRLAEIQESERRYIARELHDEAGQALASLMVGLQLIENEAVSDPARLEAARMNQVLDGVMENLHRLAMDLRPASLDFVGLSAALQQYIQTLKERSQLEIRLKTLGFDGERLLPEVETALYRIVQEAASNVIRHAHANRMDIILERVGGRISVIVEDDGRGFDVERLDKGGHLGLMGMQERAEMLGGRLEIESEPGKGTTIIVEVPDGDTHPDRG